MDAPSKVRSVKTLSTKIPTVTSSSGKLWPLKVLSVVLALVTALIGGALFSRDWILNQALDAKLKELSQRSGFEITYQAATLKGYQHVTLIGVRIGSPRWITIRRVEIGVDFESLFPFKPRVDKVYLIQPELYAPGADLKQVIKEQSARFEGLKKRLSRKKVKRSTKRKNRTSDDKIHDLQMLTKKLPVIEIIQGRLLGGLQGVWLHEAMLLYKEGRIEGSWQGLEPKTGPCRVDGDFDRLSMYCSDSMRLPINENFEVAGREIELRRTPTPSVSLQGVHLKTTGEGQDLPFSEVTLNITAGLEPNPQGEHPLRVDLAFPGGGVIQAQGTTSKESGHLAAQVSNFPMDSLSRTARGTLSADVKISAQWREGILSMSGHIGGQRIVISHPALAEGPIGPFNLFTGGLIDLHWNPKEPKQFKVTLDQGELKLGDIQARLNASWDQKGRPLHLKGNFEVPRMKGQNFAQSLPQGLLPHLQPILLSGPIAFRGNLDLDLTKLKATKLKFKANLRKLKVISHSDQINFDHLREQFSTHFEMPDGEVFIRESGPKTERWVSLENAPPLLPQAIIAQEDGGFYKHSGISLFHLRGSLIRNLKEGRFVRGGSTLTMQLTRNLFLNRKKTLSRKLEELCLTWLLERRLTKNEIIELYINIVEFGRNLFGIKEAASYYFQKEPIDLIPEEIVALTRMLPGPRLYAPFFERKRFSKAYRNRVNRLLKLLEKREHLTEDDYQPITTTSLWETPVEPESPQEDERLEPPTSIEPPQKLIDDF